MTESTYIELNANYREAKSKFQETVRESLAEWLKKNNNRVEVPFNYYDDFVFFLEGEEEQVNAISYDEKNNQINLVIAGSGYEYAWAYAEENDYVVDAVVNLYFGRAPLFSMSNEEVEEIKSEFLEGDADTRTGEIFDNYYK